MVGVPENHDLTPKKHIQPSNKYCFMSHKKTFFTGKLLLWLGVASPVLISVALTPNALLAQSSKSNTSNNPQLELPASLAENVEVKIDGSSSMSVINQTLKERFEKQFPKANVSLGKMGTDRALTALEKGEIDVAAIGRPLTAKEKAKGLVYVPISREKIAIFVGKDNPFQGDISFDKFAKVFRGEIKDWSELGGKPGKIRLIDRPEISDTRTAFRSYPVFQKGKFATGENAQQLKEDSTEDVVQELGKDGIGYAIASQVAKSKDVRIVSMHKTLPTDPRYPFSQPRGYVYRKNPNQGTKAFLAFATTTAGKQAISAAKAAEEEAGIKWESIIVNTPNPSDSQEETQAAQTPAISPTPGNQPDASGSKQEVKAGETSATSPTPGNTPDASGSKQEVKAGETSEKNQTAVNTSDTSTSQENANKTETAFLPNTAEATPPQERTLPWWVWLLAGVPMLGGLLWWLLGRGNDDSTPATTTAAAGAGAVAAVTPVPESKIVLVPRNCEDAYAYWEVPTKAHQDMENKGGKQLKLRLYDVTDIADIKHHNPDTWQEFDCDRQVPDRHLPIPVADRDYMVDLGYLDDDNQWLQIARSNQIHVPAAVYGDNGINLAAGIATPPVENNGLNTALGTLAGGAAIAGIAGAAQSFVGDRTSDSAPESRIVLVPRDQGQAYAYWEVPEADKQALRQQGGKHPALRVADVTGINLETQAPENYQQYDWDEQSQDMHVSLPEAGRDYVAELGYVKANGEWLQLTRSAPITLPDEIPSTDESPSNDSENDADLIATALAGSAAVAGIGNNLTDIEVDTGTVDETPSGDVETETSTVSENPVTENENNAGLIATALAGGAAVAGIAGAAQSFVGDRPSSPTEESRIVLVPRDSQEVYAYWEVSAADKEALRQQGGEHPALRIYPPKSEDYQQYHWDEQSQDMHISLPEAGGDYVAELGYVKADGGWLQLAKSAPISVPDAIPSTDVGGDISTADETPSTDNGNDAGLIATASAGGAAVAGIGNALTTDTNVAEDDTNAATETVSPEVTDDTDAGVIDDPWNVDKTDIASTPSIDTENDISTESETLTTDDTATTNVVDNISTVAAAVAGGAAVAGIAGATQSFLGDRTSSPAEASRIVLVPRDQEQVYAYWEVLEADKEALRQQGGQHAALRLYDVTDIDLDSQPAHSYEQHYWDELSQDMHVCPPAGGREYVVELGYVKADGKWLKLARSPRVLFAGNQLGDNVPGTIINPSIATTEEEPQQDCTITHVRVDSKTNCYPLTPEQMQQLQQTGVTHTLQPGLHLVRIKSGEFNYYPASGLQGEPIVMLWIFGGKVINKKTNMEIASTWSSLNGYADLLTLEVLETATLCAFFFDSYIEDNQGEVTISVVQI